MVRFSKEWLAIHEAKRTPPEVIKAREQKASGKLEKQLQKDIGQFLGMKGICFFSQRMDRKAGGRKGWPDFTFAIRGHACAVEAKVGDNDLQEDQLKVISEMILNGWKVAVIRGISELKQFLDEMEK